MSDKGVVTVVIDIDIIIINAWKVRLLIFSDE